jgi:hypothetical protein
MANTHPEAVHESILTLTLRRLQFTQPRRDLECGRRIAITGRSDRKECAAGAERIV